MGGMGGIMIRGTIKSNFAILAVSSYRPTN
jgi:hypothetical protein